MALLVFLSAESSNHLTVSLCLVSAHFFLPITVVNSFSVCVDIGGERACTLAGIMNFFGQAGAFVMSIFFGRIVDFTHSFDTPQYVMAGVLLVAALLWMGIDASPENHVHRSVLYFFRSDKLTLKLNRKLTGSPGVYRHSFVPELNEPRGA